MSHPITHGTLRLWSHAAPRGVATVAALTLALTVAASASASAQNTRSQNARGGAAESTHGLGLYIVRRVMDLHGGSAELVRTGAAGTVMRLTLPQAG